MLIPSPTSQTTSRTANYGPMRVPLVESTVGAARRVGGTLGGCTRSQGVISWRLVLDAIVGHLNKSVIFMFFIDTAAEYTLAWHDNSQKSRRRFMRSVFVIFRTLNFTKST